MDEGIRVDCYSGDRYDGFFAEVYRDGDGDVLVVFYDSWEEETDRLYFSAGQGLKLAEAIRAKAEGE